MATGPITKISDVIVPSVFADYVQQESEVKSAAVVSGIVARSPVLDGLLSGGGKTFDIPSFRDLDDEEENTSGDDAVDAQNASYENSTPTDANRTDAVPKKIQTSQEVGIRLARNQAWSSADLATSLAGADPMAAVVSRVSNYWDRRRQAAMFATLTGVFADNTTNDSGDMTLNISGASFVDGVTNVSAESIIDAMQTAGDSHTDFVGMIVHSSVKARMEKNDLIDFIPDSESRPIATFRGLRVIEDDGVPVATGVYTSYFFGNGAIQWGVGSANVPTEIEREALAGNGGGQEILVNRVEWMLHPMGFAYVGSSPPSGGPRNSAGTAPLNAAASWNRVYPERKQIKLARLLSREA